MCRCRMGNPKKMSRFICLKHCGEVKTMEVRHCDYLPDIMKKAIRKHNELYDDNVTEIETDCYGTIKV